MFHSLSGLWKARQGRRAAVTAILPLVERSRTRCQGITEGTWLDPYMVGFMMMLITLTARHKVSEMDSLFLGLVQQEAWAEITGMRPELVGERALNLSASGSRTFARGSRTPSPSTQRSAGARKSRCLRTTRKFAKDAGDDELSDGLDHQGVLALWADCFESHVVWECR